LNIKQDLVVVNGSTLSDCNILKATDWHAAHDSDFTVVMKKRQGQNEESYFNIYGLEGT